MKNLNKTKTVQNVFQVIDFSKASPEAINSILEALNSEVDQAVLQNRIPSIEGAFLRLSPFVPSLMM
jgi:hypothetical protein